MARPSTLDGFISYSHFEDKLFAPSVQRGVETYATAWYRARALRLFRDATDLTATPSLWEKIRESLVQCEWFILLASPRAAASEWVKKEVVEWLQSHAPDHLIIAVTDGKLLWDPAQSDFVWEESCPLPKALRGVFSSEPLWVDFTQCKAKTRLSLRDPDFVTRIATIAAAMRGTTPRALQDEDAKIARGRRRLFGSLTVAVGAVAVVASYEAYVARKEAKRATAAELNAMQRLALAQVGQAENAEAAGEGAASQVAGAQAMQSDERNLRAASYGYGFGILPSMVLNVDWPRERPVATRWLSSNIGLLADVTGRLDLLDTVGGRIHGGVVLGSRISALAQSRSRARLAVGFEDGMVQLIRAAPSEKNPLILEPNPWKCASKVTALAFSTDEKTLGITCPELYFYDVEHHDSTARLVRSFRRKDSRGRSAPKLAATALSFSLDDRHLAVGYDFGSVCVWRDILKHPDDAKFDCEQKHEMGDFMDPGVSSLFFDGTGAPVSSSHDANGVFVDGKIVRHIGAGSSNFSSETWTVPPGLGIESMRPLIGGAVVYVAQLYKQATWKGELTRYNYPDGPLWTVRSSSAFQTLDIADDGDRFVTATGNKRVQIWDLAKHGGVVANCGTDVQKVVKFGPGNETIDVVLVDGSTVTRHLNAQLAPAPYPPCGSVLPVRITSPKEFSVAGRGTFTLDDSVDTSGVWIHAFGGDKSVQFHVMPDNVLTPNLLPLRPWAAAVNENHRCRVVSLQPVIDAVAAGKENGRCLEERTRQLHALQAKPQGSGADRGSGT